MKIAGGYFNPGCLKISLILDFIPCTPSFVLLSFLPAASRLKKKKDRGKRNNWIITPLLHILMCSIAGNSCLCLYFDKPVAILHTKVSNKMYKC